MQPVVGKGLGVAESRLPDGKLLCIVRGLGYQLLEEPELAQSGRQSALGRAEGLLTLQTFALSPCSCVLGGTAEGPC